MQPLLSRFQAMVRELHDHPGLRVTHHWVGEPVTEAEIARVNEALGYELAPSILDLFRQANGLQLRWLDTGSPFYVPERDDHTVTSRQPNLCGDDDPAIGVVDLLPLAECFVERDWAGILTFDWMREETVTLAGQTRTQWDVGRAMRPFDRFSFYRSMAFHLEEGRTEPRLWMGDDHDSTWAYSQPTDLGSYLEHLLRYRGSVAAREQAFTGSRRRQDPARSEPGAPIPIDALLPERHVFTAGDRVVFQDPFESGSHRATVLANEVGPSHPPGWDRSTRFVRVIADRGDELFLSDPPRPVGEHDAYEEAMVDVPAYVARLLALTPRERFDLLGAFAPFLSSATALPLLPCRAGAPPTTLSLRKLSWRFSALSSRLDAAEAVGLWVRLIEDFLDDADHLDADLPAPAPVFRGDHRAGDTARYGRLVEHLVCALATEVFRACAEDASESLRDALGDALAERVGAVATRLSVLRHNRGSTRFSNTEILQAAVDRLPGTLPERDPGRGYRGAQFGLDDLRVL